MTSKNYEVLEHVSFGWEFRMAPVCILAQKLERYFGRQQRVEVVSPEKLAIDDHLTISVRGTKAFKKVDVFPRERVTISCTTPVIIGMQGSEFSRASTNVDVIVSVENFGVRDIFKGSLEDAAKAFHARLTEDFKFKVDREEFRTLASIAEDKDLPFEVKEAATALMAVIEKTDPCVRLKHQYDSYRFTFYEPLTVGKNSKRSKGTFALRRNSNKTYQISELTEHSIEEVFSRFDSIYTLEDAVSELDDEI